MAAHAAAVTLALSILISSGADRRGENRRREGQFRDQEHWQAAPPPV